MNRLFFAALIILVVLICGHDSSCQAQVITSNDGLEGTPMQGTPPPAWNNCNDGHSTVDTQPGFFHNYSAASQESTYISMVTREVSQPGTVETVWANLLIPFEKDKCYSFSVDLSLSHDFYGTFGWDDYYFDNPCVLQILGFNGDCNSPQDSELLWQSNVLSNFNWQTFDVSVKPLKATFQNIAIRPFFSPATNFKNSVVFVDNLRYKAATPNVFIHQDGIIMLPTGATEITWYFNDQIIPGANSIQMTIVDSGIYKATFYDANGCFIIISENISVDVDGDEITYYPNPTSGLLTLESYSSENNGYIIYLYNDIGQKILDKEILLSKGKNKTIIDLSSLPPAPYYINIKRQNLGSINFKLIVIR